MVLLPTGLIAEEVPSIYRSRPTWYYNESFSIFPDVETELQYDLPNSPKASEPIVINYFSAKPNWAEVYTLWANDRAKLSFTPQAGALALFPTATDRPAFLSLYCMYARLTALSSDEEADSLYITRSVTTSFPKNTGTLWITYGLCKTFSS